MQGSNMQVGAISTIGPTSDKADLPLCFDPSGMS